MATMAGVAVLYRSSIGKKVIMAVTGLMGIGFVLFHMYGNTKMFSGPEVYNTYAEGLRTLGEPIFGYGHLLWVARVALIVAVVLHVWAAISLTRQSIKARPDGYKQARPMRTNYAALTMRYGGIVLALFITYHVAHLTFGLGIPNFQYGNVYANVVAGFSNPIASAIYILANLALGLHIYHGGWSMLQTLGILNHKYDAIGRYGALGVALLVAGGNISFPLAVLTGVVRL